MRATARASALPFLIDDQLTRNHAVRLNGTAFELHSPDRSSGDSSILPSIKGRGAKVGSLAA